MRLSGKTLKNVNNVNSWSYSNQTYMQEGQPNELYVQLVDLDQSTQIAAEKSPGNPENPIRYIPTGVTSVVASFDSLDDAAVIDITGTQPFPGDKSIWKFNLAANQAPGSGNLIIRVTEDGVTRTFVIRNAINIDTLEIGSC